MIRRTKLIATLIFGALLTGAAPAQTNTSFTYQGKLDLQGDPYTGTADYRFTLWDAQSGGTQLAQPAEARAVEIDDGLFATPIDFGAEAHGPNRFLQIEVRTPAWDGAGTQPAYFSFPDRTPLTPAPYALQTRGIFVNEMGDRVGIGTIQPKATLHNAGDYYGRGNLRLHAPEGDGQDGLAYIQARDDSGTSSVGMQLRTQTNGIPVDALRVSPAGLVGIGRTSPTHTLDVWGNTRFDGPSATFQFGDSGFDTAIFNAKLELKNSSTLAFPDGTVQSTAYRPITFEITFGTFSVAAGNQATLTVNNVQGAEPGMAVIATPITYDLWPEHIIGQTRVTAPGRVELRIVSTGGSNRTYSPAVWRFTILP